MRDGGATQSAAVGAFAAERSPRGVAARVGAALVVGSAAAVGVAILARAVWPSLPWGVELLVFVLAAAAASALGAALARRAPAVAPPASGNLLARQLAVSAREAEAARLERFARDAPIGIVFFARDGAVKFANDTYLRIVGRSRADLEEGRLRLDPRASARWIRRDLGPRHEAEYVRDDGSRVPVLVALSAAEDGLAAFIVDLSAEKAALRAREESEARHRAIAEKLAEADRRKDEFLGMLSHELRNPLAPIRNSVFLLGRGAGTDPAVREQVLAVVERQVNHLTRLVDDLLDVTRITRGKVELRREPVELAALLRRTAEDHRAVARESGVELSVDVPDGRVMVDGDPTRLMQIVGNLLQNAVKFSSRGAAVAVALRVRDGAAEVRVRDEGAGIEPTLLAHVFEPFVQGERTLARSTGGLGLGLALVKGLTEMHGGTVSAWSEGAGRGAEFTVAIPLAPRDTAAGERGPLVAPARPPRRARVLVVEDNPDVASSLRDLVEAFGHEVELARSGDAALARARSHPPDVVLCDIGLPGMTGYDVARAFRADPRLRDARLIAVSGYAQPEDRREARDAGFDVHLAKPPDPASWSG